jgi:hypothetical protein
VCRRVCALWSAQAVREKGESNREESEPMGIFEGGVSGKQCGGITLLVQLGFRR